MHVSVILRLEPRSLEAGNLVGQVQVVETGETAVVRDTAELVSFLREHAGPIPHLPVDPHAV